MINQQLNGSNRGQIILLGDQELFISNLFTAALQRPKIDKTKIEASSDTKKSTGRVFKKRTAKLKKSFIKHSFISANAILIVVVTSIVWVGHNRAATPSALSFVNQTGGSDTPAPLDEISSADIAANIAKVASLPEAVAVSNQADSASAQVKTANVDQAVVVKPQLVAGGAKTKGDIASYTTKEGDTVSSLATKFGVTSDTIKWSNGLTSDSLTPGKTLQIPPRNGIIYKVASGDTIDSIATKYNANKDQLIVFNDYDVNTLKPGETILIPDGVKPADPVPVARTTTNTASSASNSSSTIYGFSPIYGSNGYVHGYCTYYAAARAGVPNNWGNANTWDNYARASGWIVSSVPRAGAVFQTDTGWAGHVGIVEEVYADGTMLISDMNGIAGYNRVGYARVSQKNYPNYIYR